MKLRIAWKKLLRIFAFGLIALLTLAALIATWFSYQGRKEWATTRDALLARGQKLLPADLAPPPIPPEENFFADPLWEELVATVPYDEVGGLAHKPALPHEERQIQKLKAPLTDPETAELMKEFPEFTAAANRQTWSQVLDARRPVKKGETPSLTPQEAAFALAVIKTKEPILDRLELLAARPGARFPVRYGDGLHASLEHIGFLMEAARLFRYRALARLAIGENAAALNDVLMILRIGRTVSDEPLLISALVSGSCNSLGVTTAKQGLRVWSADELLRLEEALTRVDLSAQLLTSMRGERAAFNSFSDMFKTRPSQTFSLLTSFSPVEDGKPGLLAVPFFIYIYSFGDSERALLNNHMQGRLDLLEASRPRVIPSELKKYEEPMLAKLRDPWVRYRNVLVSIWLPALGSAAEKLASIQCEVNQAAIACALQRYWLDAKTLPDSLDNLMPKYLEKIPIDVVTGNPMHYRRTGDTSYLLWSVGSNDTDENGVQGEKRNESDWVWKGDTAAAASN